MCVHAPQRATASASFDCAKRCDALATHVDLGSALICAISEALFTGAASCSSLSRTVLAHNVTAVHSTSAVTTIIVGRCPGLDQAVSIFSKWQEQLGKSHRMAQTRRHESGPIDWDMPRGDSTTVFDYGGSTCVNSPDRPQRACTEDLRSTWRPAASGPREFRRTRSDDEHQHRPILLRHRARPDACSRDASARAC